MNAKHVNYSTTSPNKFTAYKTIASLPCTVSCPGKGCYFRFHHSGTRHSNPISVRVLLICKSWTNWGSVIEVNVCRYVRMFACMSPAASLSVLLHDTVAGLEDIGILGQLHTYIHTYIHRVLVSGGTNRLPWHHIHLPLSSRTRPCLAIRISHVNAARRSANLTYTYIHIHIPADRNDYSPVGVCMFWLSRHTYIHTYNIHITYIHTYTVHTYMPSFLLRFQKWLLLCSVT